MSDTSVVLQRYGTISLSLEMMFRLIGMGGLVDGKIVKELDPHTLQLGPWLATVPEEYRSIAIMEVKKLAPDFLREFASHVTLREFISLLRARILERIDNGRV